MTALKIRQVVKLPHRTTDRLYLRQGILFVADTPPARPLLGSLERQNLTGVILSTTI